MGLLHNLTERIFFATLLLFFLTAIIGRIPIYSQNSIDEVVDWTLPFNGCHKLISDKKNIEDVASDNELNLYLITSNGLMQSVNSKNFKSNWEIDLGSKVISNTVIGEKSVYIASKSVEVATGTVLRSVSKLTGVTLWQISIEATDEIYLSRNDQILFVFSPIYIISIDIKNGQRNWKILQNSSMNLLSKNGLVDILEKNEKENIEIAILRKREIFELNRVDNQTVTEVLESKNSFIIGDKLGNIYSLSKSGTKKFWNRKTGGEITSISYIYDNKVLISSLDNFLYLFSIGDGSLIWKRRLPYRITIKPLIKGSIALIVSSGSQTLFLIDLQKGKTVNQISLTGTSYFAGNVLMINEFIVIETNGGIIAFSQKAC